MRALLLSIVFGALVAPMYAQSLEVIGYSGYLGEWELTATVAETAPGRKGYSGRLMMRHVGLCSQNGPEEKAAEIKLQIMRSGPLSQIRATMTMDGARCTFSGKFSDTFNGLMDCDDAKGVPLTLSIK